MGAIAQILGRDARRQAVRYLAVGCLVAGLYFAITFGLFRLAGLPFQLAMLVGYVSALSVHFGLHRRFTFASDRGYALTLHGQAGRYVAFAAAQYAVVAGMIASLTAFFGVSALLAWCAVVGPLAVLSFLVLRLRLFHSSAE